MERSELIAKCKSKTWFETEDEALGAAKTMRVSHGRTQFPYRCCICRLWHLTSTPVSSYHQEGLWERERAYQAGILCGVDAVALEGKGKFIVREP